MRISAVVLGIALVAAFASPSSATVRITHDAGGMIGTYVERFESLRHAGQKVIIDGPCLSACTLVLAVVPRDHLCVTSRARLGFHAAWRPAESGRPIESQGGTELLMAMYPREVREWIVQHGGLSRHVMYLAGSELAAMYPTCHPRDQSIVASGDAGPTHALARPLASNFASSGRMGRRTLRP